MVRGLSLTVLAWILGYDGNNPTDKTVRDKPLTILP
jgi:hypothetical protein